MLQAITRLYSLSLMMVVFVAPASATSLDNHPSPYLRLHTNDPVNWQIWGPDILKQAQQENKLIYLSIGYFSCHWCHVMQKESYSDSVVGRFLNKDFIAVKVDRELRPELDRRMMRFVEAVRGTAGWPLNVFLTPQGYPVTGFSYLPKDNFIQVLNELKTQWNQRHAEIGPLAQQYFSQTEFNESRTTLLKLPSQHFDKVVDALLAQAMSIGDELQGGFGDTSKFPSYPQLKALIEIISLDPDIDTDVTAFVRLTLDNMFQLHLMDQVNYGFFRYTTDPDWQTPHYEKMLYDNAQMVQLFLDAEKLWPGQGYANIAINTVQFMNRYLWQDTGGYASSLSAVDEASKEGAAYLWTGRLLAAVLSRKEFEALKKAGVVKHMEHEFKMPALAGRLQDESLEQSILSKLRAVKRPLMPMDDKKLASWNALALVALLKLEVFQPDFRSSPHTEKLYDFIRRSFISADNVVRFSKLASSAENTLEDYAYLVQALALYARQKHDREAAELSAQLAERAFKDFYQNQRWKQSTGSLIPADQGEFVIQDGVMESPVTVLIRGILMLPVEYQALRKQAVKLIDRLTRDMLDVPYHYASAIMLQKQYLNSQQALSEQQKMQPK